MDGLDEDGHERLAGAGGREDRSLSNSQPAGQQGPCLWCGAPVPDVVQERTGVNPSRGRLHNCGSFKAR